MTSSPDNTVESLDDILADFVVWCMCGKDECVKSQNYKLSKQSLDSHYLSIFLELVGADMTASSFKEWEDKVNKIPENPSPTLAEDRWIIRMAAYNHMKSMLRTALQDRLGEK